MGLHEQAAADFAEISQNTGEWGHNFIFIAPDDTQHAVVGFSSDISATVDPETQQLINGRQCSISVAMNQFRAQGIVTIPTLVLDDASKPWRVQWLQNDGTTYLFSLQECIPDRKLDQTVYILSVYKDS